MVELPLDDAATRYRKIAEKIEDIRWTMDVSDLKGATSDQLNATIEGFNTFISTAADKLMDQASTVTDQHGADEGLRDNSLPVKEIEELEEKAEKLERLTAQTVPGFSANTGIAQAAVLARAEADYERQRRESALGRHTLSASTNAPKLLVTPPSLITGGDQLAGLFGGGGTDSHDGGSRVLPQTGGGSGGSGGSGSGSAGLPSAASAGAGGGSLGGGSVDASDIGTETSSDGLMGGGTGAAGQPMMGQPMMGQPMQAQGQPQQPTMPSMAGTGAAGAGGMLGTPGGAGARNRKRDKTEPRTDLSGAGVVAGGLGGAAAGAAAAGVDRGVSVSGVTTKADTTGLGTNLSGAGGKPGGGGAPTPNMMRGGMMGGPMMGGMGSGAQGGTTRERPDIKPLVKDRDLNGLDSLERGIDGGLIGRDTAEAPDETGIDRYLDPDKLNINSDKKES